MNVASYRGGHVLPKAIENTIGQEHVFEIKVNYNGEFIVRSIVSNPEFSKSASNREPINTAPEKIADKKRGMDVTAKVLFSSDLVIGEEIQKANLIQIVMHLSKNPN